jgi:hypothetical protein
MKQPPVLATLLLNRLGPRDQSLVGDLYEEYATGRSNVWFWRQAIGAITCGAKIDIRTAAGRTALSVTTGWAVAAVVFLLGDRVADGLAGFFWQWSRQVAYADHVWWPFYIGALVVTYAGFGLSAVLIARVNRDRPAMLLAYVACTFTVLAVVGLVFQILIVRQFAVPLPHPLFYAVFTTLPFFWHSGILLVPLVMLLCGMMAARRTETAQELP